MPKFYGKIDYNKDGGITSQRPAWTFRAQIDELTESIASTERSIERGDMPIDSIPEARARIRRESGKLKDILDSKPKLSEVEDNTVNKVEKSLAKKIAETMFTRTDMQKGFVEPHKEADRMVNPIIKLDENEYEMCKENGVKTWEKRDGFYTSRNGAGKMWKTIRHYRGESGNVETLRKDKVTVKSRG